MNSVNMGWDVVIVIKNLCYGLSVWYGKGYCYGMLRFIFCIVGSLSDD